MLGAMAISFRTAGVILIVGGVSPALAGVAPGVLRHVDADDSKAVEVARARGVKVPGVAR
jgi:hypothetical protein